MIYAPVQRVQWHLDRPIGEWCAWIYLCTKLPMLAELPR